MLCYVVALDHAGVHMYATCMDRVTSLSPASLSLSHTCSWNLACLWTDDSPFATVGALTAHCFSDWWVVIAARLVSMSITVAYLCGRRCADPLSHVAVSQLADLTFNAVVVVCARLTDATIWRHRRTVQSETATYGGFTTVENQCPWMSWLPVRPFVSSFPFSLTLSKVATCSVDGSFLLTTLSLVYATESRCTK